MSTSKLLHLEHVEDLALTGDYLSALSIISDVRWKLRGLDDEIKVTIKYDGAPAIVFGTYPGLNRFFVGTKSVFNKKTPKVNFTDEDINRNHGDNKELSWILKLCLAYLRLHTPEGVYQGDVMFTPNSIYPKGSYLCWKPNVIEYGIGTYEDQYRNFLSAALGLVVHTKYEGKTLEDMVATPSNHHHFLNPITGYPRVVFLETELHDVEMTDDEMAEFDRHLDEVRSSPIYTNIMDSGPLQELLKLYANHCIRSEEEACTKGYVDFLVARMKKEVDKASLNSKIKKIGEGTIWIHHAITHQNMLGIVFHNHKSLQAAKNVLIEILSKNAPYNAVPEGFVVHRGDQMVKLVNRSVFSKANFDKNG